MQPHILPKRNIKNDSLCQQFVHLSMKTDGHVLLLDKAHRSTDKRLVWALSDKRLKNYHRLTFGKRNGIYVQRSMSTDACGHDLSCTSVLQPRCREHQTGSRCLCRATINPAAEFTGRNT